MTIKQYLLLMIICTILCWGGWVLVLFFINPQTTSTLGFLLFYLSLLFALIGSLALISYAIRAVFSKKFSKTQEVQISFRQAIFFSLVVTVSLFLQGNRLLTWLNILLLVLMVTVIEFLILSLSKESEFSRKTLTEPTVLDDPDDININYE